MARRRRAAPPAPRLLLLLLPLLLLPPAPARAANWAQISGAARQNVAVPAPAAWTRRWGHALAAVETLIVDRTVDVLFENERSRLYVLGGDSWKRDTSGAASNAGFNAEHFFADGRPRDPNYNQADPLWSDLGSGALLNDVWWSTGAAWGVLADERVVGRYGDPLPRLVSKTTWTQSRPWAGIPPGIADWREYLGCCHANPVRCTGPGNVDSFGASLCPTAFPCPVTDVYGENLCSANSPVTGGLDVYAQARRWSPRRGHRAVTVYPASIDPAKCPRDEFLLRTAPCGQDASGQTVWPARATLLVMGGRARALTRMTAEELNGGFLGSPDDPAVAPRDRSVLVSDVWLTQDSADGAVGGDVWDVINQGCWVAQVDQVKPPGVRAGYCLADVDCWNSNFGDAMCVNNACACRHWTPRERFGATVRGTEIFVSGGISYSETLLCGRASCGTEYATFLNDVWVSRTLGQTWVEVARVAAWAPRADHAFVVASSRLWVIGGRGGDVRDFASNPLFADSYFSPDLGRTWVLNATRGGWTARSEHAVLALEQTRPGNDGRPPGARLMLLFGQEEVVSKLAAVAAVVYTDAEQVANAAALAPNNVQQLVVDVYAAPPPGQQVNSMRVIPTATGYSLFVGAKSVAGDPFARGANRWWPDFDESTPAGAYVGIDAPAPDGFRALNYTDEQLGALANASVTTIYELSVIQKETVLALQQTFDAAAGGGSICYERRRAEYIVKLCETLPVGYDGDWFKTLVVVEGIAASVAAPAEDIGCDAVPAGSFSPAASSPWWTSPTGTRYLEADYVCRQLPRARRGFGAVLMTEGQDEAVRAYVAGGWEAPDVFANDVWYRDERLPQAFFTRVPGDGSFETIFAWDCLDDLTRLRPACLFEYRMTDVASGAVLRDWSRGSSPFDSSQINKDRRATRFDLRAVDPAGNRDLAFEPGRNTYTWSYVPPFPIVAVTVSLALILAAIIGTLYAIRQYEKRVALEIYMARRMARKLRAEGAGVRKKVVVVRKKKVKVQRTSVEALRDASERDKFKAVLGGRAERSSRQVIDVDPTKRLSAKERFAATSAVARVEATRDEVDRDARRFEEETARAKAMLRGRAVPLPQGGVAKGGARLATAAPSLKESAALAAASTPAYAQTLRQFNEARRKEEAERAAEKKGEAKINFVGGGFSSPLAARAPSGGGGGGGGDGGGGGNDDEDVRAVHDSGTGAVSAGAAGRQRVALPPLNAAQAALPGQVDERKNL